MPRGVAVTEDMEEDLFYVECVMHQWGVECVSRPQIDYMCLLWHSIFPRLRACDHKVTQVKPAGQMPVSFGDKVDGEKTKAKFVLSHSGWP